MFDGARPGLRGSLISAVLRSIHPAGAGGGVILEGWFFALVIFLFSHQLPPFPPVARFAATLFSPLCPEYPLAFILPSALPCLPPFGRNRFDFF